MTYPCEQCMYYEYDEEFDEYECGAVVSMDEDEYGKFVTDKKKECVYFRAGNEYQIVKHQM